ncbi:MAG: hypothetical protein ACREA4_08295, partial [Nitrososphaera sp.]
MIKRRKFTYDYYAIPVSDLRGDFTDLELAEVAIIEACERTRLYCLPCEWRVVKDTWATITVRRKRYRRMRTVA